MKIQITVSQDGNPVFWTNETSSSRYGIGAVSLGTLGEHKLIGDDYGPADIVPRTEGRSAAQICADMVLMDRHNAESNYHEPYCTAEEVSILARFCAQWPDGPQIRQ